MSAIYRNGIWYGVNAGSGDTFQVTVPSSGWVSHDTYFTVDIPVYGITSDVSLVLDVVPDLNNYTVDLEQWGKLIKAETGAGVITLYTKEAFSSPVTMLVKSI